MLSKITAFTKVALGMEIPIRELKMLTRSLAARDLHRPYEFVLGKVDPSLDLSYTHTAVKKKFLFEGRGHNTLKPYRILEQKNGKVFEKIFFNNTEELGSNLYFYQNLQNLLGDSQIKVPGCLDSIKGKKFTILLFEFLDLQAIPRGQEYEVLSAKTLDLYQHAPKRAVADNITFDKFQFGKNRLMDKKVFSLYDLAKAEQLALQAPVYFQHLDLNENNVFLKDQVIDWDNSGFFPLGMDFGRLLLSYFLFFEKDFFQNFEGQIEQYYKALSDDVSFEHFRLMVLFFFIVFFHGNSSDQVDHDKIKPLVADFKNLLNSYQDGQASLQY